MPGLLMRLFFAVMNLRDNDLDKRNNSIASVFYAQRVPSGGRSASGASLQKFSRSSSFCEKQMCVHSVCAVFNISVKNRVEKSVVTEASDAKTAAL